MMHKHFSRLRGRPVFYIDSPGLSGVRLPYKGSGISAVAVLPKEADPSKAAAVVGGWDLGELLNAGAWRQVPELEVTLPKFKVKNDLVLTQVGGWVGGWVGVKGRLGGLGGKGQV
jgi:serine protease inhibitor